jgi:hypothetical protein
VDALLKHARAIAASRKSKLRVDAAREGITVRLP